VSIHRPSAPPPLRRRALALRRLADLGRQAAASLVRNWARNLAQNLIRMRDPRTINPIYVFAAGLTVVVPIWLLFLNR
jgi:hypothetical protein